MPQNPLTMLSQDLLRRAPAGPRAPLPKGQPSDFSSQVMDLLGGVVGTRDFLEPDGTVPMGIGAIVGSLLGSKYFRKAPKITTIGGSSPKGSAVEVAVEQLMAPRKGPIFPSRPLDVAGLNPSSTRTSMLGKSPLELSDLESRFFNKLEPGSFPDPLTDLRDVSPVETPFRLRPKR